MVYLQTIMSAKMEIGNVINGQLRRKMFPVPQLLSFFSSYKVKFAICNKGQRLLNVSKTVQNEAYSEKTFFGYETVSPEEKQRKVQSVFTNVASSYDLMNDIMSVGIHRYWKDYFISVLDPIPPTKLLDVAGGTGDIAFRFLKSVSQDFSDKNITNIFSSNENERIKNNQSHVTVLDINSNMLEVCKQRAQALGLTSGITYVEGAAESLPFSENMFDAYTIVFGIRNVACMDKTLREAYRVLKTGGRFLCLEFGHVKNPLISRFYDLYSFQVIPCFGQIIAKDWQSYQYLVESIRKFSKQEEFSAKMEDAGFSLVTYENLLNGIAVLYSGYKI